MNFGLKNKNNKTTYQAPFWTRINGNKIANFEKIGATLVKKKTSTDSTEKDKKDDYQYTSPVTPAKTTTTNTTNTLPTTTPMPAQTSTPKTTVTQASAPASSLITTTTKPSSTDAIEKIKQPYEDILPKTSEKTEATPLKITGRQIKQNVYNVISKTNQTNTYKTDIFDDIDDDIVEKSIPVAEQAIDTNLKTGKLTQNSLKKFPYLRDGLTMFYAAGEKGNKKAAQAAMKSAYVEDNMPVTSKLLFSDKTNNDKKTVSIYDDKKGTNVNIDLPKNGFAYSDWKNSTAGNLKETLSTNDTDKKPMEESSNSNSNVIAAAIKKKNPNISDEHLNVALQSLKWKDHARYDWELTDAIKFAAIKTFSEKEAMEFIYPYKAKYVETYRDVIKDAAEMYDIPPLLLAGIGYNEFGGDPMILDDLAYNTRNAYTNNKDFKSFIDKTEKAKDDLQEFASEIIPDIISERIPDAISNKPIDFVNNRFNDIKTSPNLTSFGNMSVQVRRAREALGYDSSTDQVENIIESLKDPIQNIYIAAKHLSELCDKDYKGVDRNKLTDEQIRNIASRYQTGPQTPLDYILANNGYGQQVIDKKDEIMKALGYK